MRLKRLAALALGVMLLLCAPAGFAGAEEETVTYRGITVSRDTEEVDLGKLGIQDWGPFYEFLGKRPNLKKVSMYNTVLNQKVYQKLIRMRHQDETFVYGDFVVLNQKKDRFALKFQ